MGYFVKHRSEASYGDAPMTGPFIQRDAAERFVVALANSGKCFEAKIVSEEELEKQKKADEFKWHATATLCVDYHTLRSLTDEQVAVLFRASANVHMAENNNLRKKNRVSAVSGKDAHEAKVELLESEAQLTQAGEDLKEIANQYRLLHAPKLNQ